jgi:hypothetical protein
MSAAALAPHAGENLPAGRDAIVAESTQQEGYNMAIPGKVELR